MAVRSPHRLALLLRPVFAAAAIGAAVLLVGWTALAAPSNDNFADAVAVASVPYSNSQSTSGATSESGEPQPCGNIDSTVWFRFKPSADIQLVADTLGSDYDTVLAVYTGSSVDSLSLVGCNDDASGLQSRIIFDAVGGTTYHFQVGGYAGDTGDLSFNLDDASHLGSISGTVTDEATGYPLEGVCVDVFDTNFNWWGSDLTDRYGDYTVDGLEASDYKVLFSDCIYGDYISEWYDDQPDFDSADPVPVAQGSDTPNVDAALALGGSISGTVTDEVSGDPLEGICVDVFDTSFDWWGFGYTDASGNYSVGGLATGDYKVLFWDCFDGAYISEWYDDQPDFDSADPVSVTQGSDTPNIDAALALLAALLIGDVDCDGDVDAVDALFILQAVAELRGISDSCPGQPIMSDSPIYRKAADADCDGDVDAVDALFVLQLVAELRSALCPA